MPDSIIFTDRYDALGLPPPDPTTMCRGQCEGTGYVPVYVAVPGASATGRNEIDPELLQRWHVAELVAPSADGWHFVRCPRCEGSRLDPQPRARPQTYAEAVTELEGAFAEFRTALAHVLPELRTLADQLVRCLPWWRRLWLRLTRWWPR